MKFEIQGYVSLLFSQKKSQQDKVQEGFSIIKSGGMGFDYICAKIKDYGLLVYWVECKYNQSPLTKKQKKFMAWCKRMKLNFLIDRISPDQLQYWIDKRGAV